MSKIYREFVLDTPAAAHVMVGFLKSNAGPFKQKGMPLRAIITSEEQKRNNEQNRFYWGVILRDIAEQAWVSGKQFDKDTWHEWFARKYGVCEEITLPDGEIVIRRKSTTQMTIGEFSTYMHQVQANAAAELGVRFE